MQKLSLLGGAVLAILLAAGCETGGVSSRIQEKAAVFGTLSEYEQKTIKGGGVDRGYTQDMVYMALGKPTLVQSEDTPQGKVEKWTYGKYYGPQPTLSPTVTQSNARYNPRTASPNTPSTGANASGDKPGGISSTAGGPDPGLSVPDMVATTLYIFFLEGAVYDLKIKEP